MAQTFFGQMLKQMRDSPFKSKLFDGGHGGEAFQQMADQRTGRAAWPAGAGHRLVDAIVAKIERAGGRAPPNTAAAAVQTVMPSVTGRDWGRA